ncbi:MAG: tellurite resistance TerB family protein [Chromatiaceae bacterium]|nr:tellurite resistance TerB family protein [Chromatiaceae bacterium]
MSALDWLKQQASTIQQTLGDEMTRFKNRDLMEGVVAGCAMVGYANGTVSAAEKQKMMGFLQSSDAMKVYDITQVLDTFGRFSRQFEFDTDIGQAEALKVIGKLRNKPDEARLLVRVCCAIGSSDGDFEDSERQAARSICRELGLDPADFYL